MASILLRGKTYHCDFYWREMRFRVTTRQTEQGSAEAFAQKLQETIGLVEEGRISGPSVDDPTEIKKFFSSFGKPVAKPRAERPLTLGDAFEIYFTHYCGTKEANSLATERTHAGHLKRILV